MIESPYRFEKNLAAEDFQKVGQLSLRWSHTEHVIANCLKVMLRLTDEEAIIMVFPLGMERRIEKLDELRGLSPLTPIADRAFLEFKWAMKGLSQIRNTLIHAILLDDAKGDARMHLRSKGRSLEKQQVFDSEEITNYAAIAALTIRHELGMKYPASEPPPLPDRPAIPKSLQSLFLANSPTKRA